MSVAQMKNKVLQLTLTTSSVKKAVTTHALSKRYMNTMLRATVINILYHRLNIDDKEFINKKFENVSFKTFKPKAKDPLIRDFHTFMGACKEALEKNYLKDFYLFFIEVATGDIIENYKFTFQYASRDEAHEEQDGDVLVESTCDLLRTLEDLGKHTKYNAEIQLKVELTYYQDTPQEYEPPSFRSVSQSECLITKINKNGNSVIIGTLSTGYHTLKCRGKGEIFNFRASPTTVSEEAEPDDNERIEIGDSEEPIPNTNENNLNKDIFTEDYSDKEAEEAAAPQDSANEKLNCTYISNISNDEVMFFENCPCKNPDMDSVILDQIKCKECSRIFHAPCMGYLDGTFLRGPYTCKTCSAEMESMIGAIATHSHETVAIHRLRLIIGAIYKYGQAPIELRNAFAETFANLQATKVFETKEGDIVHVNKNLLQSLFNFEYKQPNMTKFKKM